MARVLAFRNRNASAPLDADDAVLGAEGFLGTPDVDRDAALWERLSDADLLTSVLSVLRSKADVEPLPVSQEAVRIHGYLSVSDHRVGVFDEKDYFLGELALVAGACFRHLGQFEESARWLERAEASFRHTVDPAPHSARVAYARLAIHYDVHKFDRVLEDLPSVIRSFQRLGMAPELKKAHFLEAMALKEGGRFVEAMGAFQALRSNLSEVDTALLGRVLIEIGSEFGRNGELEQAIATYQEASLVVAEPMTLAHLRGTIAETYRDLGQLSPAIEAFRSAMKIFAELGMQTRLAYYRVITAETLLKADRPKEAEWEIRTALPVIQEQQLVPEGLAALALLQESLERRKLDGAALLALRQHLGATA